MWPERGSARMPRVCFCAWRGRFMLGGGASGGAFPPYPPSPLSTPAGWKGGVNSHILFRRNGQASTGVAPVGRPAVPRNGAVARPLSPNPSRPAGERGAKVRIWFPRFGYAATGLAPVGRPATFTRGAVAATAFEVSPPLPPTPFPPRRGGKGELTATFCFVAPARLLLA